MAIKLAVSGFYTVPELTVKYLWMDMFCCSLRMKITFVLSLVSRGHDFPDSAFRKQHNTDLSVRLCLDPCMEQRESLMKTLKE